MSKFGWLTRELAERAIKRIRKEGIPPRQQSTKFDLIDGANRLPPKLVVRRAAKLRGKEFENFGGGVETNSALMHLGFDIEARRTGKLLSQDDVLRKGFRDTRKLKSEISRKLNQSWGGYSPIAGTMRLPSSITKKNPGLTFAPEFEGRMKKYELAGTIGGTRLHGAVVNVLYAKLKALGFAVGNTRNIDLFCTDAMSNVTHLFEVKTDKTTTSLYQAVGQVMLHGVLQSSDLQRVVVLPGKVSRDTARRMKVLGIKTVRYDWMEGQPIFQNLKKAISG